MGNYLIPANTKKSMLYFGIFSKKDLILFSTGIIVTFILLYILQDYIGNIVVAIISLLPVTITGFLVMPVPNYHNVLTLINTIINFYTGQRKFKWKGWCYKDGK